LKYSLTVNRVIDVIMTSRVSIAIFGLVIGSEGKFRNNIKVDLPVTE